MNNLKGTKGILMRDMDGVAFFRVYAKDFSFKDYMIVHNDLAIIIDDEDSAFVECDGDFDGTLDHHPVTLGLDNE